MSVIRAAPMRRGTRTEAYEATILARPARHFGERIASNADFSVLSNGAGPKDAAAERRAQREYDLSCTPEGRAALADLRRNGHANAN